MRTTLNIDDDVLDRARAIAVRRKTPFREVVNEALRAGLPFCRGTGGESPVPDNAAQDGAQTRPEPGQHPGSPGAGGGRGLPVILVDANILLYTEDRTSPRHEAARRWWDEQLSGSRPVCLCWSVLCAFIRIGTNPRVFEHPLSLDQAVRRVQSWLEQPCTRIVHPTQRHWSCLAGVACGESGCRQPRHGCAPGGPGYRARL